MKQTIQWTPNGNIDVPATIDQLRNNDNPEELLTRLLYEVWADGYTYGWSDGVNHRDPNAADNPYSIKGIK